MSHKIFDSNINGYWNSTKIDADTFYDIEKKLLVSLKFEDTLFICSDRQYLANKLAICKYSTMVTKLILAKDKILNKDYVKLYDVCGYDFFLFKHFVYTKDLFPLEKMTRYYELSFIFESQPLMTAFFKYLATDNGNISELLELFKFQHNVKDSNMLSVLLNCRKLSLEKLRISRLLITMDIDELTKFNFFAILNSWRALEAFSFIEFWIAYAKEKRIIFKDHLYSCVNLSLFNLKYSRIIPNKLYIEIISRCRGSGQLEYVRKIHEYRQHSIINYKNRSNTIDYRSFDIDFWRRQNIRNLTQEFGDANWFQIVLKWYHYNEENNVHYLVEMFQHVDFTQIDSSFLTSWVTGNATILSKRNIFRFFVPYIKEKSTKNGIDIIEEEKQKLESSYNLPDTPLSLTSSEISYNYNVEFERNMSSRSINNNLLTVSLDTSVSEPSATIISPPSLPTPPERNNYFFNDPTKKVIKEEPIIHGKNNSDITVVSNCSFPDKLNTVEVVDRCSTDSVYLSNDNLNDIEKKTNSGTTVISQRLKSSISDDCTSDKENNQENTKEATTELTSLFSTTNQRNEKTRRLKKPQQLRLVNYETDESKNEINCDVQVIMIGGVSGIKKEELKPARNLCYSSKFDEYEYFPELNRDRKLTKIAEYEEYLFAVGGKIYVNGKWDSALEFCRYDKMNKCWIEMDTCLQSTRCEHDVAVVDKRMFIVGGNDLSKDKYSVMAYDFPSEKFFKFEYTANDCIYQHSNIVIDNVIYIVGGYKFNQSRLLQRFDPRVGKFETLSTPSVPHLFSATVFHGERIYCSGGKQSIKDTSAPMHYNDTYDIRSNKWIQLSGMPTARCGSGSSVIGNEIFVFGGATRNGGTLKIVEKYNFLKDKWSKAKCMGEERGFFGIYSMSF